MDIYFFILCLTERGTSLTFFYRVTFSADLSMHGNLGDGSSVMAIYCWHWSAALTKTKVELALKSLWDRFAPCPNSVFALLRTVVLKKIMNQIAHVEEFLYSCAVCSACLLVRINASIKVISYVFYQKVTLD